MNRKTAEDFVYASYVKAEPHLDFNALDKDKRHPELTKELIEGMCKTPAIIVTGSKGKGSVSSMISQILQTQYKVGLMTSPHIDTFNERFKINGENIGDFDFVSCAEAVKPAFDEIESKLDEKTYISPIGIQAAIALEYFNRNHTNINIFECGKGVESDDVNNVKRDYSVINSIFLEHTRELGKSEEEIAMNKSAIISGQEKCAFIAKQKDSVMRILKKVAHDKGVKIKTYGEDFEACNIRFTKAGMLFDVRVLADIYPNIRVPLLGEHQAYNCALAFAVCKEVLGEIKVDKAKEMLEKLYWPGRLEIISKDPVIILDACINRTSCEKVVDSIRHLNKGKFACIVGIPDDKDYLGVIKDIKPLTSSIILTRSSNPHYIFTDKQLEVCQNEGIDVIATRNFDEAITIALEMNTPIVILGTTSLVSDTEKWFKEVNEMNELNEEAF